MKASSKPALKRERSIPRVACTTVPCRPCARPFKLIRIGWLQELERVAARAAAVDELLASLWAEMGGTGAFPEAGVALVAVGGYGRRELFPYSDVDLMFLIEAGTAEKSLLESIRRLNQALWDSGLRVSTMTRTLAECGRFDAENVEFTLALLDARYVAGHGELVAQLVEKVVPGVIAKHRKRCIARLLEVTQKRHSRYGDTLFHLEPNVKECPGGLRDVHVCEWLARAWRWCHRSAADGAAAAGVSRGARVFADGADLPAPAPRSRRQHARLAGAGRGRRRASRDRPAEHRSGLLDAALFSSRTRHRTAGRAVDRRIFAPRARNLPCHLSAAFGGCIRERGIPVSTFEIAAFPSRLTSPQAPTPRG